MFPVSTDCDHKPWVVPRIQSINERNLAELSVHRCSLHDAFFAYFGCESPRHDTSIRWLRFPIPPFHLRRILKSAYHRWRGNGNPVRSEIINTVALRDIIRRINEIPYRCNAWTSETTKHCYANRKSSWSVIRRVRNSFVVFGLDRRACFRASNNILLTNSTHKVFIRNQR